MLMRFFLVVLLLAVFPGCVTVPTGPVCNKPYILVGETCCLDRDDNRICDRDEATTSSTVTTSTTTTTPSSTTSTTSTSASSSTTRRTTTTTQATSTSTSTSTTTTSTTTTTLKRLPVTESIFMDHIIESKEYRNTLSDYGRRDMELFVDSEHYYDARDLVERIDDNNNLNCLKCFNFSRKEVWISEFGIKDHIGFSCILDSQTGTGAMYRFAGGSKNVTTCRCDEI